VPELVRSAARGEIVGALLLAMLLMESCSLPPSRAPFPATVSLRMRGAMADAMVVIDDETLGTFDFVASHGVALPPGVHRVTIQAMGYFPWDREIEAKGGSPPVELEIVMTPVPE
jgi:hypothetical protein